MRLDAVDRWCSHVNSLTDAKDGYRANLRNHVIRYAQWLAEQLGIAVAADGALSFKTPPDAADEASPPVTPEASLTKALLDADELWAELYLLERSKTTESNGSIATILCSIRRLYEFFAAEFKCSIVAKELVNPRVADENQHPLTEAWLASTGLAGGSLATRRQHIAQFLRYVCDARKLDSLSRASWRKERIATAIIIRAQAEQKWVEAAAAPKVAGTLAGVLCYNPLEPQAFLEAIAQEQDATSDRIKDRVYVLRGFYAWMFAAGLSALSADTLSNPLASYARTLRMPVRPPDELLGDTGSFHADSVADEIQDDEATEDETANATADDSGDAASSEQQAETAAEHAGDVSPAQQGEQQGTGSGDVPEAESSDGAASVADPEPGKKSAGVPRKPRKGAGAKAESKSKGTPPKPIVVFRLSPRRDTLHFSKQHSQQLIQQRNVVLAEVVKALPEDISTAVLNDLRLGDLNADATTLRVPKVNAEPLKLELGDEAAARISDYLALVRQTQLAEVLRAWHDLAPLFFSLDGGTLFVDEPEPGTNDVPHFIWARNQLFDFFMRTGKFTFQKLVTWDNGEFRSDLSRQLTMNSENLRVVELNKLVRAYDQAARLCKLASVWTSHSGPLLLGADGGPLSGDE